MVHLRSLGLSALAACSIAPVFAIQTPAQVVGNIHVLTQKSQALQAPASSITLLDAPLLAFGLGNFPVIIAGFADIVSTATIAMGKMKDDPPVSPGFDSDSIFDAFREFVYVHQALLNILIGKAGLFSTVPYIGKPVAFALRGIEKIVDTIALALIAMVQSRAADLQSQAQSLNVTIKLTITKYEGLSTSGCTSSPAVSRIKRAMVDAAA